MCVMCVYVCVLLCVCVRMHARVCVCMHMCLCMHTHLACEQVTAKARSEHLATGPRITGGCDAPGMDAGNSTQEFRKGRMCT